MKAPQSQPNMMTMEEIWPEEYEKLLNIGELLEAHYRDVCDFEFTVEKGRLYILNVRRSKRTHIANLRFAFQFYQEGKIGLPEALNRICPDDVEVLVRPKLINKEGLNHLGSGLPASPGAASGR